ncbi:hypothetical protein D9M69_465020 [compost metagenome]
MDWRLQKGLGAASSLSEVTPVISPRREYRLKAAVLQIYYGGRGMQHIGTIISRDSGMVTVHFLGEGNERVDVTMEEPGATA